MANISQPISVHQLAFDLFQRDTTRFWHEDESDYEKQQVETRIQPECGGVSDIVDEGQECRAHDHVGDPVGDRRAGNTEIATLEWLDLGTQCPDEWARGHRETNDEDQQHDHGKELLRVRDNSEMHHRSDDSETDGHHAEAGVENGLAPPTVDQADRDKGCKNVGKSDQGREPHLLGGGVTHALEYPGCVIHHHVHAGELLHQLQHDAQCDRPAEISILEK